MKQRLTINDAHHFPESLEGLKNLLDFARGQVNVDLSLTQILDRKPKLLTRILAWIFRWNLAMLKEGDEIWARINGNQAIALFHYDHSRLKEHPEMDLNSLSLCSTNPEYERGDRRKVEFIMGGSSDRITYPGRNCIATDKVLTAFLTFYKTGLKPDCVDWEIWNWENDFDVEGAVIDSDL